MTLTAANVRRFAVHARHLERHRARLILKPTFEEAAVAYVEHLAFPDLQVSLLVRDLDSGEEHCFRIDLESGASAPCA